MKDVIDFACRIREAGGRALLVGGIVRDMLMGSGDLAEMGVEQDVDIEVYNLPWDEVREALERFDIVHEVGKQFGVMKAMTLGWDVSLPRTESKSGPGHKGFSVNASPHIGYEDAARRRDLTINAVSYDPLSGELIDPMHGKLDIEWRLIRMADPLTFGDDPLRALRVARFAARFPDFRVDPSTLRMVGAQPIHELPAERIFVEFKKILLGEKPSRGFDVLKDSGLLRYFPIINELRGVPQDPGHHPEGCVYTHTMMVIDEAAKLRVGDDEFDLPLMFGALSHDFGKPLSTSSLSGKIHTRGHEDAGAFPAREFMRGLKAPTRLVAQVGGLVECHLKPQLMPMRARMKGYRRLMRKLNANYISPNLLAAVSIADTQGRGTTDEKKAKSLALNRVFLSELDEYTRSMPEKGIEMRDAVTGRHLIAIGMEPGIEMGNLLVRCRSVQDEIGMSNEPGLIITTALKAMGALS